MTENFKEVAISAAKVAGEIIMKHYSENQEVNLKTEDYDACSVVTEVDLESEKAIIEILKNKFPDFGVYGEESKGFQMDADYIWYIDPLDGTSNFIRHIPLFGVSIGLAHKGNPIVGVLHFPALGLMLSAEEGHGAYANGKQIKVSNRNLAESLYYAGGKYKGELQLELSIATKCGLVKTIDSSSYEFAQIAMGDAEIYYLANVPHDVAAGVCIVREAGGMITDNLGNSWHFDSKMILATNGTSHQEIINHLK